jgi:hypothetical protein
MNIQIKQSHFFYNPFTYIAGFKSLIGGAIIVLLTAWICFISGTHNYGLINVNFASDMPFSSYLAEHAIHWIAVTLTLYSAGLLFSKSRIRFIDVLGTQGISKLPLLVLPVARLVPVFASFPVNSINMYFLFVLHIIMVIWSVALMFNAFKISCNVKGQRLVVSFILALLLAEIVSRTILYFLF